MANRPLVKVEWLDAHGTATTVHSVDDIPHAGIVVQSYGILLRQDDAGVSIASEVCDDDSYRGYTFVPAGMVRSVAPVISVRKRKPKTVITPEEPT